MLAAKFAKMFEEKFAKVKGLSDSDMYFFVVITACRLTIECTFRPPPSLEEKTQFSRNLYVISSEQLGKLVQLLDQRCDTAMDKVHTRQFVIISE